MRRRTTQKQEIIRETIVASGGYTYKYTLSAGMDTPSTYSLKIVMSGGGDEVRSNTASVAMTDGGRAIAFYNKLVRNLATPANLQYCIEDDLC